MRTLSIYYKIILRIFKPMINQIRESVLIVVATLFIIFLMNSCYYTIHKRKVILPDENFVLDQNVLRSDGYYYKESTYNYLERYTGDTVWHYSVSGVALYSDGYVRTSLYERCRKCDGFTTEDDCIALGADIGYEHARRELEKEIVKGYKGSSLKDEINGKCGRGVFIVKDKSIKFQTYHPTQGGPRLEEKGGEILNDSTIVLTSKRSFPDNTVRIYEVFKFKKFEHKPDSLNYIREHRSEFRGRRKF